MRYKPAQPRGDGRRRSLLADLPSAFRPGFSARALVILVALLAASCKLARPRGYVIQLNDVASQGARIDDVAVWPVIAPGELMSQMSVDAFTGYIRQGLIGKQYSVLSGDFVKRHATGANEAAARSAHEKLEADGTLIVTVRDWDERGFDTVGSLAVGIDFKLVNAGGDLWSGSMKGLEDVIRPGDSPRNLQERRDLALQRIAAKLVARMPAHVLR